MHLKEDSLAHKHTKRCRKKRPKVKRTEKKTIIQHETLKNEAEAKVERTREIQQPKTEQKKMCDNNNKIYYKYAACEATQF